MEWIKTTGPAFLSLHEYYVLEDLLELYSRALYGLFTLSEELCMYIEYPMH